LTLLAAVPALAVTWVSHSGIDSAGCGNTSSPCRSFAMAYTNTNSGGIIKAMDAADYGPLEIDKPIILDGNGVGASIEGVCFGSACGGVSVGTFSPVVGLVQIRNLSIHIETFICNPCDGIDNLKGSTVIIENVEITGAPVYGVYVNGGTATIHGVTVTGATTYGILVKNATATISDSIIRYSSTGIYLFGDAAVTQALIERSQMISNTTGLGVQYGGFATTARISDCVITGNAIGVSTVAGGQIITFRNNTWAGNTTDGSTPFSVSQK
jgi:nitrous oxidase accessory protein NosD